MKVIRMDPGAGPSLSDALAELAAEVQAIARGEARDLAAYLDELLTAEQVARIVQVEPGSVYRWVAAGAGPRRVKLGGAMRFTRADVLEWIRERAVEPRRGAPRRYRRRTSRTQGASHATAAPAQVSA